MSQHVPVSDQRHNFIAGRCVAAALAVLLALLAATPVPAEQRKSFDDLSTMLDLDPELKIPPEVQAFDERLAPLWNLALGAPDADARRRSAETIAYASSKGMTGLEVTIPNLRRIVTQQDERPLVQLAAARALIQLDDEPSAASLFAVAQALGGDAEGIVASSLGRWRWQPARDVWLARLSSPVATHRELRLALQGLEMAQDPQAVAELTKLVSHKNLAVDLRLAAARALATSQTSGLESLARQLAALPAEQGFLDRLLAATALQHHDGDETRALLEQLALDTEPVVASAALARLFDVGIERIVHHRATLLASSDANVRRWAIRAVARFPSVDHISTLIPVLNDPHPDLRVLARDTLLDFAKQEDLTSEVIQQSAAVLDREDWRGLEQSCRILGELDHKPVAPRMLELLTHERGEVAVTSAWCLRKLAVEETLPGALQYSTTVTNMAMGRIREGQFTSEYDPQLSQLFQLFGLLKYQPADPLLRRYVPKFAMSDEARAAAIWTLGHLHAGQAPKDLVPLLEARLADAFSSPSEVPRVRQLCAISLGRMKGEAALPTLRRFYELDSPNTLVGAACGWAVTEITGEQLPGGDTIYRFVQGWFLLPAD
jgi:HEAT repeat protein